MASKREAEGLPVREACQGDGSAWDLLFRRYQLPLYAYVVELIQDKEVARDVVQETFINAVRYIGGLRDDSRFGSWLFGIARQKCQQHWRRKAGPCESLDEIEHVEDARVGARPDEFLLRQEEEEEFMEALRSLSPLHREVLLLHFLEGFSLDEIADIAGVASGTVKSRIHYAKQALRERMKVKA